MKSTYNNGGATSVLPITEPSIKNGVNELPVAAAAAAAFAVLTACKAKAAVSSLAFRDMGYHHAKKRNISRCSRLEEEATYWTNPRTSDCVCDGLNAQSFPLSFAFFVLFFVFRALGTAAIFVAVAKFMFCNNKKLEAVACWFFIDLRNSGRRRTPK